MHINDWSNPYNFGPIVKDTVIHVVNRESFSQRISPIAILLNSVMSELDKMNSDLEKRYLEHLAKDETKLETQVVNGYVKFVTRFEDEIKNAQLGGKLRKWDDSHDGRIKKLKEAFKKIQSFEFSMFSRKIPSDIQDEIERCLRTVDHGYRQDMKHIEQAAVCLKDDLSRNSVLSINLVGNVDTATSTTQEIRSLLSEVSYFNNSLVPWRALNDYQTLIEITDCVSISVSHSAFEIITSWELKNMNESVNRRLDELTQKYRDLMSRLVVT